MKELLRLPAPHTEDALPSLSRHPACSSKATIVSKPFFFAPRWQLLPAAAVFHSGGGAKGVLMASKLTVAHAGQDTLALMVPQQSRGTITTSHTDAKLFTIFWIPTMVTTHRGTLLVLLATRTQDSWTWEYMQIRRLATLSGPQVPVPLQEKKVSNILVRKESLPLLSSPNDDEVLGGRNEGTEVGLTGWGDSRHRVSFLHWSRTPSWAQWRAYTESTGHRQSLPGAQPHTASKHLSRNGSLSTSP